MVQAKEEADPAFAVQQISEGSDDDEIPEDPQLLKLQKRLSIPRVQISEFNENEDNEKVLLDVAGEKLGEVEDSPLLVGMMSAGAEDKMFKKYSLESPGLPKKMQDEDDEEETKKA